ncbi:MAG TPA: class I SAM-dependent methyltransferase [Pyrinomonadaceae bacterium]|nr:class I SAM-dependent methyltransferase [Pyrinomonadaceae bacterium]
MKALLKKILPRPLRATLRRAHIRLSNGMRTPSAPSSGNDDQSSGELLPPKALQDYIGGGYREAGPEFLRYFKELCDLRPDDAVLDVGCGSGRMAVPLTNYLSGEGLYHGFDISAAAIDWCRRNITPVFPNFNFQVSDIHNAAYPTGGRRRASEFRFPFEDQTFDLVFLTSVFTHMLPNDMEHYFSEIARVLKPGARCLITFFLLNEEATALIDNKMGTYNFEHHRAGYRTINGETPENAVAYDETFIRSLYERYGLKVREPIHYGYWCGRKDFLSFQDIVVAEKARR